MAVLALLIPTGRLVMVMLHRQRAMDVHLRRRPSDPVEDMKTVVAMDQDLRPGGR